MKKEFDALNISKYAPAKQSVRSVDDLLKAVSSAKTVREIFIAFGSFLYPVSNESFDELENAIVASDMKYSIEEYIGRLFLIPFALLFSVLFIIVINIKLGLFAPSLYLIVSPVIIFLFAIAAFYYYPLEKMSSKRASIDANLPFALNHLAAIASSGAPPEKAFKILAHFSEFGGVATEAINIVERIELFGEDITTAISQVIQTTPSEKLKEVLSGILTISRTGGSLEEYLKQMSEVSMFDYELSRKQYTETLSTYADIYTAILIAAPLFIVSILTVMNIIPNTKLPGGISIPTAMIFGVYIIIPVLNVFFLMFVNITQPEA